MDIGDGMVNEEATDDQSTVSDYDSVDTATVKAIDTEARTITLTNIDLNRSYTLDYDGTTVISDKYDNSMSMAQLNLGEVVEAYFIKASKKLVSIRLSPDAFVFAQIDRYSLDGERGSAVIGNEDYRLKNSALIISEGREIGVADIVSRDTVTVRGIGRSIFSVVVEKGHGYLRLEDDAHVIGGWIEVGPTVIQRITEGMLLTVPEGAVEVHISAKGVDTIRRVFVERNKEMVIDLGDLEIEQPKMGKVHFTVTPENATIFVDGDPIDSTSTVELDYGLHQIICEATGYDTITQYIKVSQEIASVVIAMDETTTNTANQGDGTTNTGSNGNSGGVSDNSLVTGSYLVYIDAPEAVEVYQDGVYMGVSPVRFLKVAGSHTITLRKSGYVTKSYTVQIDNLQQNVTYSFSDLEKAVTDQDDDSDDQSGVSDNQSGVSGNN
jgi:Cu/Ag efflux protein CusF